MMATDEKAVTKEARAGEKAEKKEKKEKKRSKSDGIHKDKKDRKKDKSKQDKLARVLDAHLQADAAAASAADVGGEAAAAPLGPDDLLKPMDELAPFALPLADEKAHKKIYKLIKKGARLKAIHRGVKECEKAIKKCPLKKAGAAGPPPALVVIAGDISPMDVIMHFPILCEEHGVPYIFVRSRADLGVAACTKRATSVVMLRPEGKKGKDGADKEDAEMDAADADDKKVSAEEYLEAWGDLVKLAEKRWTVQVEPWVKGTHPLQLAANALGAGQ